MDITLRDYNQYTTESILDWKGLRSNKFPKPRLIHPRRDLIQSGTPNIIKVLTCPQETFILRGNTTSPAEAPSILSDQD